MRQISSKLNITFIVTIDNLPLIFFYRDLTSRPHLAGLQEDLDSAIVIEQRWENDGLQVNKPKYNVLLSYPDDNVPNQLEYTTHTIYRYSFLLFFIRVSLTTVDGTLIFQTNGTEKVYDPLQSKTVKPFLAYTLNGTVSSVSL